MALPTTISGIYTGVAPVGPFKSSGGNYYFIGVNNTGQTNPSVMKATDPTSSFSAAGTDPSLAVTLAVALSAFQVGDAIHVAMGHTNSANTDYRYFVFDMSSDTWTNTGETIQTGLSTTTSTGAQAIACSIVVRSDSTVVVLYNGTRIASMGNSYSRIVYARRAAGGGWTTNVAVDVGGQTNGLYPKAVLGTSDRIHFFYNDSTLNQKHLTSANSLGTAQSFTGSFNEGCSALSFNSGRAAYLSASAATANKARAAYFASADNPTVSIGGDVGTSVDTTQTGGIFGLFADSADLYAVYRNTGDSDLYVAKSTDNGATFAAAVSMFVGTVGSAAANFSKDGAIYQRGSDYVIPYIVNDNGTLKYNEYVVRSTSSNKTLTAAGGSYSFTGTAATLKRGRKVAADTGSYAITGTNATLRKGYPIAAGVGSYSFTGQAATLRKTWLLNAASGSYAFTGTAANLKHGWKVAAGSDAYAITGTDVTFRRTYVLVAGAGSYAFTGTAAGVLHGWKIAAGAGAYALTGSDATLTLAVAAKSISADAGSYAFTGTDATLRIARRLSADVGSYALIGTDATPKHGWKLAAGSDSYALTGTDATFRRTYVLAAGAGSYAFTGTNATLKHGWKLSAGSGSYAFTGTDATPKHGWKLAAGAGAYAVSGASANLFVSRKLAAGAGSYAFTGTNASLLHQWKLAADSGSYAINGTDVTLRHSYKLTADAGAYSFTGTDANLTVSSTKKIAADSGNYEITGSSATLLLARKLIAESAIYLISGTDAALTYAPIVAPPAAQSVGGRTVRYSRKQWEEYKAAKRAQHDAQARARKAKKDKERNAIEVATQAANHALAVAKAASLEERALLDSKLVSMTNALDALAGAKTLKTVMAESKRTVLFANALLREMEAQDEEEEAIMLLMSL